MYKFILNYQYVSLLSTGDIEHYHLIKAMLPKIIRFSKAIKEILAGNKSITGICFEKSSSFSNWFTFYWLQNSELMSRNNDNVKLKNVDFDFMIESLKNIFPNLRIIVK
jgi:hypothetical protein